MTINFIAEGEELVCVCVRGVITTNVSLTEVVQFLPHSRPQHLPKDAFNGTRIFIFNSYVTVTFQLDSASRPW